MSTTRPTRNAAAIHTRRQPRCGPLKRKGKEALARGPAQTARGPAAARRAGVVRRPGLGRRDEEAETAAAVAADARRRVAHRAGGADFRPPGEPEEGQVRGALRAVQAGDDGARVRALGGTKADLKYDIQRGWVTVLAPPVVAAEPAPAPAEAGGSPGSSASSDSAPRSTDPVAYLPEVPAWLSPAGKPLPPAPARRRRPPQSPPARRWVACLVSAVRQYEPVSPGRGASGL